VSTGLPYALFQLRPIMGAFTPGEKSGSLRKELRALSKTDVLILDYFGLSKLDTPDRLSFLEILKDRWGKTSTVVVAQRPFDTWYEILGDPTVADAIRDRLFSNAAKLN